MFFVCLSSGTVRNLQSLAILKLANEWFSLLIIVSVH